MGDFTSFTDNECGLIRMAMGTGNTRMGKERLLACLTVMAEHGDGAAVRPLIARIEDLSPRDALALADHASQRMQAIDDYLAKRMRAAGSRDA
jgi:hypothetical protein